MDNRDFSDWGERIRDSVQGAIDSRDYKQLNKIISDSVNAALDEARTQMAKGMSSLEQGFGRQDAARNPGSGQKAFYEDMKKPGGPVGKDYHTAYRNSWTEKKEEGDRPGYRAFQNSGPQDNIWTRTGRAGRRETTRDIRRVVKTEGLTAAMKQQGRIAGILLTVFGSVGLAVTGILFIVIWLLALLVKPFWGAVAGSSTLLLILAGGSAAMLAMGVSMRRRLKRAQVYLEQMGSRTYCEIGELARNVGRSHRFVARDLQKLIEKGILPGAHIDEQKTCLILGEETYQQYLQSQKALKQRQQEALLAQRNQKALAKKEKNKTGAQVSGKGKAGAASAGGDARDSKLPEGMAEMIAQGREYVRILREANEAIPGQVISDKLSRLERVISQIFASVEKHPEQMGEMEKFMDYYLPTTVKLVNAYRDFDGASVEGENIVSAKKDIEETIDTINGAFERLLDDLYKEKALDASTDAVVLKTMLKKDGWAESDFHK